MPSDDTMFETGQRSIGFLREINFLHEKILRILKLMSQKNDRTVTSVLLNTFTDKYRFLLIWFTVKNQKGSRSSLFLSLTQRQSLKFVSFLDDESKLMTIDFYETL